MPVSVADLFRPTFTGAQTGTVWIERDGRRRILATCMPGEDRVDAALEAAKVAEREDLRYTVEACNVARVAKAARLLAAGKVPVRQWRRDGRYTLGWEVVEA